MIQLVCPACGKKSDRVKTKLVILALGYMRIVPGREVGIERAVASPVRSRGDEPKTKVETENTFICLSCGEETPADTWRYSLICDHCGSFLHSRTIKNPAEMVDEYICRDSMSLYCNECWSNSRREYCEDCRFSETCLTYNNR